MGVTEKPLAFRAWYGLLAVALRCQDRVSADVEREAGLPLAWFEVLAHLSWSPAGRARMSELADELLLSRGGATRLVARMEDAGLLERVTPREDRRATYAVATDAGRERFERAFPMLVASIGEHLGNLLEEGEQQTLVAIMGKLLRHLDPGCAAHYEGAPDEAPA